MKTSGKSVQSPKSKVQNCKEERNGEQREKTSIFVYGVSESERLLCQLTAAAWFAGWPETVSKSSIDDIGYGSPHDRLDTSLAAWVASLDKDQREAIGESLDDAIWMPKIKKVVGA